MSFEFEDDLVPGFEMTLQCLTICMFLTDFSNSRRHGVLQGVAKQHVTLQRFKIFLVVVCGKRIRCVNSVVSCDFRICILSHSSSLTQTQEKLPLYLDSFWSRSGVYRFNHVSGAQLLNHDA